MKDEISTDPNAAEASRQSRHRPGYALDVIGQRIQTSRASLDDPNKPVGVFMLVGPSGVGKTETALAFSDLLYGGEHNLITINMSEFQEAHTVSTLKGSPPGYVGYGEGGVLTEAVRRRPYSVVSAGRSREGASRRTRALLPGVRQRQHGGRRRPPDRLQEQHHHSDHQCLHRSDDEALRRSRNRSEPAALVQALKPELNKIFKPAFLGRMVIVPYYPVRDEALKRHHPTETWQDSTAHSGEP